MNSLVIPENRSECERAFKTCHESPDQTAAEAAVKTLLRWAGDDPDREGLRDTPKRVALAYREFFSGYDVDPARFLERTFEEAGDYKDMVILRNVAFDSHCEHHLVPIIGIAHVAYIPRERVVGISKLARVVEAFAKRLQIQERLTSQIADAIESTLDPRGVAVLISAQHQCMTTRGVKKPGVAMVTKSMRGIFRDNETIRAEFLSLVRN